MGFNVRSSIRLDFATIAKTKSSLTYHQFGRPDLCLSPFLGSTNMYPGTTDCARLSATYSYIAYSMRMTRLIHVLCASSQLQGSYVGGGLVTPPGPFSPHGNTSNP